MKKLYNQKFGILASWNCSVRLIDNEFAIKPTGMDYWEIDVPDICTITNGSPSTQNKKKASSDYLQHQIIYRNNPDVNCIIHTHSHYATILAIIWIEILVFCTMHADFFWRPVKCFPFVNHRKANFWDNITYNKGNAFLLGRHGTISLGRNIEECYKSAVILEESAKLFFHSKLLWQQLNKDVPNISQDNIDSINHYYHNQYWQ